MSALLNASDRKTSSGPSVVEHHHNLDILKSYDVQKELGSGSFSTVKLVIEKSTGKKYADKVISKTKGPGATEKGLAMIEIEIEVLKRAKHGNSCVLSRALIARSLTTLMLSNAVIKLHEIFENDDEIHLILDLVEGGELFDEIVALQHYSEKSAARVVQQLTSAIQHLHLKKVIHRDLKPENLLLSEKSESSKVLLADFGLAALVDNGKPIKAAVGTPGYIAPEVLKTLDDEAQTYGQACDIFGIGVITYILLCGYPPFYADDDDDLFDMTIAGNYKFLSPYWDEISPEAKDLVRHMLEVDPMKRYTCDQILAHPWIQTNKDSALPMAQEQLKQFRAQKRWKKGINAIVALKKFNFGKSLLDAAKAGANATGPEPSAPPAAPASSSSSASTESDGTIDEHHHGSHKKKKKRVVKVIQSVGDH